MAVAREGMVMAMQAKDLIFDVGLHRGEDTDFYLRKGFRVVAFEADPDHVAFCRQRFHEPIEKGQLTIVQGAIIDPDAIRAGRKKVSFYKNETVSVFGTVCDDWVERNEKLGLPSKLIEVEAVDFAAALEAHGVPHYLKIDIEGCDMLCVKALKDSHARPDYLSIESSKTSLAKIKQELEMLSELGYTRFQAVEQSAISSQAPPLPPKEGKYVPQQFEMGSSGLFGAELAGSWRSKAEVLRQYRYIWVGYYLLGDNGILTKMKFRGAGYIRLWVERLLQRFTRANVPGWYDTHAC
jgi:FkbM family methyltransferase